MPLGDRLPWHKHKRRLVRFGDRFDSGELERGEVELELPEPSPEPAEEPSEPWGWTKAVTEEVRARLAAYREAYPEAPDGAE